MAALSAGGPRASLSRCTVHRRGRPVACVASETDGPGASPPPADGAARGNQRGAQAAPPDGAPQGVRGARGVAAAARGRRMQRRGVAASRAASLAAAAERREEWPRAASTRGAASKRGGAVETDGAADVAVIRAKPPSGAAAAADALLGKVSREGDNRRATEEAYARHAEFGGLVGLLKTGDNDVAPRWHIIQVRDGKEDKAAERILELEPLAVIGPRDGLPDGYITVYMQRTPRSTQWVSKERIIAGFIEGEPTEMLPQLEAFRTGTLLSPEERDGILVASSEKFGFARESTSSDDAFDAKDRFTGKSIKEVMAEQQAVHATLREQLFRASSKAEEREILMQFRKEHRNMSMKMEDMDQYVARKPRNPRKIRAPTGIGLVRDDDEPVFRVGDKVKVGRGELGGLVGQVTEVSGQEVFVSVERNGIDVEVIMVPDNLALVDSRKVGGRAGRGRGDLGRGGRGDFGRGGHGGRGHGGRGPGRFERDTFSSFDLGVFDDGHREFVRSGNGRGRGGEGHDGSREMRASELLSADADPFADLAPDDNFIFGDLAPIGDDALGGEGGRSALLDRDLPGKKPSAARAPYSDDMDDFWKDA